MLNNSKIYYLSFYDVPGGKHQYRVVSSGANKSHYILDTLSELDLSVNIIAAGYCVDNNIGVVLPYKRNIDSKRSIYNPLSICLGKSHVGLRISNWVTLFFVLLKLLSLNKKDTLIVYHSFAYDRYVRIAKRLKRFRLILELEEIYSDVSGNSEQQCREKKIIEVADGYMFSTELLEEKYNIVGKPSVVCNGIYRVEPRLADHFADGKIHVVYAGTFDPRKGGVVAAAAAAALLPSNYHFHICGFGSPKEIELVKEAVRKINDKGIARVTYEGMLTGEHFLRFIQQCHIGVSTQDPNALFNSTSFPSKILTYLSNGLSVVSIRIPAIERSGVRECITFYEEQTPENIAQAILNLKIETGQSPIILNKLHKEFKEHLMALIKR